MPLYKIADIKTELLPEYPRLIEVAKPYLISDTAKDGEAQIRAVVKQSYLEQRYNENKNLSLEDWEYFLTGCVFSYNLIDYGGFVLHSSSLCYEGQAYLFSADSGTGKSTHVNNWISYFGKDKVQIINDDKPAIRKKDGRFYCYGTPFSGKNSLNSNVSYPLKSLCFIHRSEENEIRKISPDEALSLLFKQTLRPRQKEKIEKLLEILNDLLTNVPSYSLGCNMDVSSAKVAFEGMRE